MTLLVDFGARAVGGLSKNDDCFSRHGDVAVALEHFQYSSRHLARTAHQFSQLLPSHPNLHPIRVGHGLGQCGELNERSVNASLDIDKRQVGKLARRILQSLPNLGCQRIQHIRELLPNCVEVLIADATKLARCACYKVGRAVLFAK